MFRALTSRLMQRLIGIVALGVLLSAGSLVWLGYRAVTEWRQSATESATRRAEAAVDLLVRALTRDMRSLQTMVLPAVPQSEISGTSFALLRTVAAAFAKYPYPEAFFAWSGAPADARMAFYVRSERLPSWLPSHEPYELPVVTASDPEMSQRLLERIARDGKLGRRFSTFDVQEGNATYQVVASLRYADAAYTRPVSGIGFMVNMEWVRRRYFQELADQVQRLPAVGNDLVYTVIDGQGQPVVGAVGDRRAAPSAARAVPLLFFDPTLVAMTAPADLRHEVWTAKATVSDDPMQLAAGVGTQRALTFGAATTLLLVVSLLLSVQGLRAKADLTALQSDFVSTVTHELKTPIATMKAIAETFVSGRGMTPEISRKWGMHALHEVQRLSRLIDNMLAYARMTDVADVYTFEPLAPQALIEDVLREYSSRLEHADFEVVVDAGNTLPAVRADRRAMSLVFGNLVDNAIRYSRDRRYLRLGARVQGTGVVIEVADRGMGIPGKDLPHVTRKFFRGRTEERGGSGLGLAIVDRIVADHGGSLGFESVVGDHTTVSVTLPVESDRHAETDSPG